MSSVLGLILWSNDNSSFLSKNLEEEMLPPTWAALPLHIMRANYMTMREKTYIYNVTLAGGETSHQLNKICAEYK